MKPTAPGYFTPYTVASEADTIAVPGFDIDLLGYRYFAQAAALLHDLFELMRQDRPPGQRQRLLPIHRAEGRLWRLRS